MHREFAWDKNSLSAADASSAEHGLIDKSMGGDFVAETSGFV